MGASLERHDKALLLAQGIRRLAHNIWLTWNPRAQDLFKELSEEAWVGSNHNALAVLEALTRDELIATLHDKRIAQMADEVIEEFDGYLTDEHTWGAAHCQALREAPVAYFSAEFGLHESLPIYSGGLGILAGDHIKSASDLDVPLVGVTLFYRGGYFTQSLDIDGWQQETYPSMDPRKLPVTLVTDANGKPVVCRLKVAHSEVAFHAWRLEVGRNALYLLDADRPENDLHWREVTSRVYGGDQSTRVCQELILGVGGVRFLRALGIQPSVYHLNEGHSAFGLLELMRMEIEAGHSLDEAREKVRRHAVFTTHTPVAAGHDWFSRDLLDHLMHIWPAHLGIDMDAFMDMGRVKPGEGEFCMTVLALRNSRHANAVSELNGQVSREMWRELYPGVADDDVPIGHVTNGVHLLGWMNRVTYSFWEYNLGMTWLTHMMKEDFWQKVADPEILPDEAIWALRYRLKRQMIEAFRARIERQNLHAGVSPSSLGHRPMHPDALTIGFARRFATYKRANLLFSDEARAAALFNDPRRPLQMVLAGKAHPRDDEGKKIIQEIHRLSRDPRFSGKLFFIEDYNIQVARYMVSGCDVWLNNPRRPHEASGTSGMKTTPHGCLNLSILDGWWREGYDGTNGFAIGEDHHTEDTADQDRIDTESLYNMLENELIPEFYDRDEIDVPRRWIQRIRRAMITLIPLFNTDRMVAEYAEIYLNKH